MFNRRKNKVILRNEKGKNDTRFLSAEFNESGDLVIKGQDLGAGVIKVYGSSEYEWVWTIKAENLPHLQKALEDHSPILNLLKERFSDNNASKLLQFLQKNNIAFERWSRLGD